MKNMGGHNKTKHAFRLEMYRQKLLNAKNNDQPILENFKHTWEEISGEDRLYREDSTSDNVLGEIAYYADLGLYPPPEVLLLFLEAYEKYMVYRGELSLEDVFFPDDRGSKALHFHKEFINFSFSLYVEMDEKKARKSGEKPHTKIKLAEQFLASRNIDIDPESFLRTWRRQRKG